tara:strand:- start:377 stop:490 length:114 start_codon:yes stop_codon:yes gene_type:complete
MSIDILSIQAAAKSINVDNDIFIDALNQREITKLFDF